MTIKKQMNILDVGCGGRLEEHRPLSGENVVSVDIDTEAKASVRGDIQLLPFPDNSFDIVYASHVLEHVHNPMQAVEELKRVTKNIVIIKVPNAHALFSDESVGHYFSWNRYTLRHLLEKFFAKTELTITVRYDKVHGKIRKQLYTLKVLLLTLLSGQKRELTAICYKKP